jgi:hypothetical protein
MSDLTPENLAFLKLIGQEIPKDNNPAPTAKTSEDK